MPGRNRPRFVRFVGQRPLDGENSFIVLMFGDIGRLGELCFPTCGPIPIVSTKSPSEMGLGGNLGTEHGAPEQHRTIALSWRAVPTSEERVFWSLPGNPPAVWKRIDHEPAHFQCASPAFSVWSTRTGSGGAYSLTDQNNRPFAPHGGTHS